MNWDNQLLLLISNHLFRSSALVLGSLALSALVCGRNFRRRKNWAVYTTLRDEPPIVS